MRGDHHRAVLLPIVQRKLPLVVEGVLHVGSVSPIPVAIFVLLLLYKGSYHVAGADVGVLWLHAPCVVRLLLPHGDGGVLGLLQVCPRHLLRGENRLSGSTRAGRWIRAWARGLSLVPP